MIPYIHKIEFQVLGGHTHCRIRSGTNLGSLGLCGELTFQNPEFESFRSILELGGGENDKVVFEEVITEATP